MGDARTEPGKPVEMTLIVARRRGLAEELVRSGWIPDAFCR